MIDSSESEVVLSPSATASGESDIEVAELDRNGMIVAVNDAWLRFAIANSGDPARTGVGVNYLEICDLAGDAPAAREVAAAIRRALDGEMVGTAVIEIPCHSPETDRWFNVLVSARTDRTDAVIGATVVLTLLNRGTPCSGTEQAESITPAEARQLSPPPTPEAGLRPLSELSESRMWHTIELAPDAILMTDEHGLILMVNRQVETMFGYDRGDLLGRSVDLLLPHRHRAVHAAHRAQYHNNPGTRAMEARPHLTAQRADGTRFPVEVSLSPIDDGDDVAVVASVRDITERVTAEERLQSARAEADRQRSRQASLSEALSELRLKMLQGASRAEGLELICAAALRTLDASTAVILTPTGVGDELAIETAVNLSEQARTALRFNKSQGVVGQVFATGKPLFTTSTDPLATPGNRAVMANNRTGSVVVAPLQNVDNVTGVLIVVRNTDAESQFVESELAGIDRFASEAVIAIELAAYRDDLQKMELLQERERIAEDLHHRVIQRLFAAGMGLQAIASTVEPPAAAERIIETVAEIDATIAGLRSSIFAIQRGQLPDLE